METAETAGARAGNGGRDAAIGDARPAGAAEWEAAWRSCPYATYFQSPGWAADWSAYTHGAFRPEPLLVTLSDGRRVVLPLTRERRHRGLAHRYHLSPAGTYGGWLAEGSLTAPQAEALLTWVLHSYAPLWWRVNPFDPCAATLRPAAGEPDVTHVLHLGRGVQAAFQHASRGHRSALGKARRSGVVVRRAAGAEDWARYYEVYRSSLARWGSSATSGYAPSLFELLRRRGSPHVELWLAEMDDVLVAGALCVYGPRHASYWHGAALGDHLRFRPVNLLMHELVVDACGRGLDWFDLNPSGGLTGVATFKERLGAESLECPMIHRERPRDRLLDRLFALANKGRVAIG
jgi:CelD/BcsL family acetyltransferase involved in cellulose biosynthesis